ncbi:MAG: hypothetical protein ABL936_00395 [Aestuariivirga sp.]
MLGYLILGLLLVAVAFVLFSPWLKGFRTQIFGGLTVSFGAIVPLLTQITDYLQTLDWRQYLLNFDRKNVAVLGVVGGLGVMAIVLRYMTTGPANTKE